MTSVGSGASRRQPVQMGTRRCRPLPRQGHADGMTQQDKTALLTPGAKTTPLTPGAQGFRACPLVPELMRLHHQGSLEKAHPMEAEPQQIAP
jgi:hypothetical protein